MPLALPPDDTAAWPPLLMVLRPETNAAVVDVKRAGALDHIRGGVRYRGRNDAGTGGNRDCRHDAARPLSGGPIRRFPSVTPCPDCRIKMPRSERRPCREAPARYVTAQCVRITRFGGYAAGEPNGPRCRSSAPGNSNLQQSPLDHVGIGSTNSCRGSPSRQPNLDGRQRLGLHKREFRLVLQRNVFLTSGGSVTNATSSTSRHRPASPSGPAQSKCAAHSMTSRPAVLTARRDCKLSAP